MVNLLVQVVINGSIVAQLDDAPSASSESWGGKTDATVFVVKDTDFKESTFPCHVELVPAKRVREWARECPGLYDLLGGPENLYEVTIRRTKYVLFITPFAR